MNPHKLLLLWKSNTVADGNLESINAGLLIAFGLALYSPFVTIVAPSLSYYNAIGKAYIWAAILILTGLAQVLAILKDDRKWRIGIASFSVFLWTFTTLGALAVRAPAFAMYAMAAIRMAWFVLTGVRRA